MKKYHEPWKKFAEKYLYVEAPTCPSKFEINLIESKLKKILKNNKRPSVLILGCTFSYRKLLAKYKLAVDLADLNRIMFKVNSEKVKNMKTKERFFEKNWIAMDLKKKYDLILGDFVVNNIHAKYKKKFYDNIKKHMKDDGLFITRVYWQKQKLMTKEQIYPQYKNKRITRKLMNELWFDAAFNLGVNLKNGITDNSLGWKGIKDYGKHVYMKK
ncbi:hypothetical protein ACFL96_15665, partial [Thermoproteota archaeon]